MKVILFIPGVGGSIIQDISTKKKIFPKSFFYYVAGKMKDSDFQLLLNNSNNIKATGIITHLYGLSVYGNFYTHIKKKYNIVKTFNAEQIINQKNGKDIFCFVPWNFHLGIREGLTQLKNMIVNFLDCKKQIFQLSNIFFDGFILIGHSAGGLVAQYFNELDEFIPYHQYIKRIIYVGTPFLGSFDAYLILINKKKHKLYTHKQMNILNAQINFNLLYDLLPKNIALDMSKLLLNINKFDDSMNLFQNLHKKNSIPYIIISNDKKKTKLAQTVLKYDFNNFPINYDHIKYLQSKKLNKNQSFYSFDEFVYNNGDGIVASKNIFSSNCIYIKDNTSFKHPFLFHSAFIQKYILQCLR